MSGQPRIRMQVELFPEDPRDRAIIQLLRNVAPRRRVSKLKHMAYEGILRAQDPPVPSAPLSTAPVPTATPPSPSVSQVSAPARQAPITSLAAPAAPAITPSVQAEPPPDRTLVPASEFLDIVMRQGDKFSRQSWDGK